MFAQTDPTRILESWRQRTRRIELAIRRILNAPIEFPAVPHDIGVPTGAIEASFPFPPISAARDQSFHLVRARLTELVLRGNVSANAFHDLHIICWTGDVQIHLFQPVWVEEPIPESVKVA